MYPVAISSYNMEEGQGAENMKYLLFMNYYLYMCVYFCTPYFNLNLFQMLEVLIQNYEANTLII